MVIISDNVYSSLSRLLKNNFYGKLYSLYNSLNYVEFVVTVKDEYSKYKLKSYRLYGPSVIFSNGEKYWVYNKTYGSITNFSNYSQKQFLKDLSKQWLY